MTDKMQSREMPEFLKTSNVGIDLELKDSLTVRLNIKVHFQLK